jgi:hypothetical protein
VEEAAVGRARAVVPDDRLVRAGAEDVAEDQARAARSPLGDQAVDVILVMDDERRAGAGEAAERVVIIRSRRSREDQPVLAVVGVGQGAVARTGVSAFTMVRLVTSKK